MGSCSVPNEFLCRHSLFGGLITEELEILRPYLEERHYDTGAYLLTQGTPNNRVFFIVSGEVVIQKHSESEQEKDHTLAVMQEGDSFGEMELIDVQPCAASAVAAAPTRVITLTNGDLYQLSKNHLKTYTMIIMNLAREISRRLRKADEKLVLGLYTKKNT